MKVQLVIILQLLFVVFTYGQNSENFLYGEVWVIDNENIYVKFKSTIGIMAGDTLFEGSDSILKPVLIVDNLSSISCVGKLVDIKHRPILSTKIIAKKSTSIEKSFENIIESSKQAISPNDISINSINIKPEVKNTEKFSGRISVSSYTNMSTDNLLTERIRYNLSFDANRIKGSKLSAESYLTFHQQIHNSIKSDYSKSISGLKIYNLSLKYELNKTSNLYLGRKTYSLLSNVGAVDGFLFEKKIKNISVGLVIGSRPDYFNYGFNPALLQFGCFTSHTIKKKHGFLQSTFAIFEQLNSFKTDRRLAYFQHTNSLFKNLNLFCSLELDLVKLQNDVVTNTLDITNSYISLKYRPFKTFSASVTYDLRKNIYYYETFSKNRIDSLLDKETRQGFRLNAICKPFDHFQLSGNFGYRFIANQAQKSLSVGSFASYTQLPFDIIGNLSFNMLKTGYIKDMYVYGTSINRDFKDINIFLEYRFANIEYQNLKSQTPTTTSLEQNIMHAAFFWRLNKKLTFAANVEVTLEKPEAGNRIVYGNMFINLNQRFQIK